MVKAAREAGYRLAFLVHKNIEPYIESFEVPAEMKVYLFGDGSSVQHIFRTLSLFVTDYTSASFDVSYLKKPVIYYQFDRDLVFNGGHTTRPGYFDYERDGFGPVCFDEDALLDAIESFLDGTPPDPIYRERAEKTFIFRDGKCCERVFDAIMALERPADRPSRQRGRLLAEGAPVK